MLGNVAATEFYLKATHYDKSSNKEGSKQSSFSYYLRVFLHVGDCSVFFPWFFFFFYFHCVLLLIYLFWSFFFLFLSFFFSFIFISWRLITLQYCSGFCHTLTWISHGFTCVLHPDPPSHLPLYPIPLGLPSAPGLSTCPMHPTWAGDLSHPR